MSNDVDILVKRSVSYFYRDGELKLFCNWNGIVLIMVNPVTDHPIKRSIPFKRPICFKTVFDFNLFFY